MNIQEIISSKVYIVDSLSDVSTNISNRVVFAKDTSAFTYWNGTTNVPMVNDTLETYTSLPLIVGAAGTVIYVTDSDNLYVSNGTEWVAVGGSSVAFYDSFSALPTDAEDGDMAITTNDGSTYYYNNGWSSGATYTNSVEVPVTIGGIEAGTTFENESLKSIVNKLLYPEMFSTVGTPTNTLSLGNSGTIEVGVSLSNLKIEVTLNKSTIAPYYDSTGSKTADSVEWAGDATSYTITSVVGLTDYAGTYTVGTDDEASGTSLLIPSLSKAQEWGGVRVTAKTTYGAGSYDVYSSYGELQRTASGGTTATVTTSITSSLPVYATSSETGVFTRQSTLMTNIYGTITATMTVGSGATGMAVESPGGEKQAILVPAAWLTGDGITVEQYNTLSGSWDTQPASEYDIISNATIDWTAGTVSWDGGSKIVSGNPPADLTQAYKVVVYNGATSGARALRFSR